MKLLDDTIAVLQSQLEQIGEMKKTISDLESENKALKESSSSQNGEAENLKRSLDQLLCEKDACKI